MTRKRRFGDEIGSACREFAYAVEVQLGGRDVGKVAKALLERRHYHAALNMVRLYKEPAEMFRRYLTARGDYPFALR